MGRNEKEKSLEIKDNEGNRGKGTQMWKRRQREGKLGKKGDTEERKQWKRE